MSTSCVFRRFYGDRFASPTTYKGIIDQVRDDKYPDFEIVYIEDNLDGSYYLILKASNHEENVWEGEFECQIYSASHIQQGLPGWDKKFKKFCKERGIVGLRPQWHFGLDVY